MIEQRQQAEGAPRPGGRRPHRPAGRLNEMILAIIRKAARPIRVIEIRSALDATGEAITPSLVFRALGQLSARGAIQKVELARGYVAGTGAPRIALVCDACGDVSLVACEPAFAALDELAGRHGLSGQRFVIEVPGRCAICAATAGDVA
ncbi:hypothetical protein TPR58_02390 [Sphingomonas sp. HF-S3]|uniref:Ferric uptake regulation protein n=1 Tax=Sphingomonas rustica TaxID=3103142 RepID=A0ABV0B5L2_9SPHN